MPGIVKHGSFICPYCESQDVKIIWAGPKEHGEILYVDARCNVCSSNIYCYVVISEVEYDMDEDE
jgi:hypothetical protein